MTIKKGSTAFDNIKLGSTNVDKVMLGTTQVWSAMPAPVGFYDFHEGSGTTAADVMGNLTALTANGFAWNAFDRQTANDAFSWNTSTPISGTGQWSVAIDIFGYSNNNGQYPLDLWWGGTIYFWLDNGKPSYYDSSTGASVASSTAVSAYDYHCLVWTYDGLRVRIYADGVKVAELASDNSSIPTPQVNGTVNNDATGHVDNVRFWDVALSDAQVASLVPTDSIAPSVPTGLVSSAINPAGFTVSWNAATDNQEVMLYEVRVNGGSAMPVYSLSRVFSGLVGSTSYNIEVRAKDTAGNASAWSSVLAVSTTSYTGTVPSPFANYDFHEGSGGVASDLMGNFSNLTATNSGTAWSGSQLATEFSNASPFKLYSTTRGVWTFAIDVYIASFSGSAYIYWAVLGSTSATNYIYANTNNQTLAFYSPTTGAIIASGTLSAASTYRIVVTSDGEKVKLYLNGVAVGSGAINGLSTPKSTSVYGENGNWPAGNLIDDIRIWDVALSAEQVATLGSY